MTSASKGAPFPPLPTAMHAAWLSGEAASHYRRPLIFSDLLLLPLIRRLLPPSASCSRASERGIKGGAAAFEEPPGSRQAAERKVPGGRRRAEGTRRCTALSSALVHVIFMWYAVTRHVEVSAVRSCIAAGDHLHERLPAATSLNSFRRPRLRDAADGQLSSKLRPVRMIKSHESGEMKGPKQGSGGCIGTRKGNRVEEEALRWLQINFAAYVKSSATPASLSTARPLRASTRIQRWRTR